MINMYYEENQYSTGSWELTGHGKTNKHCWFAHNLELNILNTEKYYTKSLYSSLQVKCED
jgi:hypothetical protein